MRMTREYFLQCLNVWSVRAGNDWPGQLFFTNSLSISLSHRNVSNARLLQASIMLFYLSHSCLKANLKLCHVEVVNHIASFPWQPWLISLTTLLQGRFIKRSSSSCNSFSYQMWTHFIIYHYPRTKLTVHHQVFRLRYLYQTAIPEPANPHIMLAHPRL